jgi:hypothetical protein
VPVPRALELKHAVQFAGTFPYDQSHTRAARAAASVTSRVIVQHGERDHTS